MSRYFPITLSTLSSKKIDDKEQKILTENYNKVIHNGADGDQEIIFRDSKIKISGS